MKLVIKQQHLEASKRARITETLLSRVEDIAMGR